MAETWNDKLDHVEPWILQEKLANTIAADPGSLCHQVTSSYGKYSSQYFGCWCPGNLSIHCQGISNKGIDLVRLTGPCLLWGKISTTWKLPLMTRNYINCELTLNVRGPSYLGLTRSISWLLMPWLLTSPGHQQPQYWLCRICRSWSYLRKDFKNLCHINVE